MEEKKLNCKIKFLFKTHVVFNFFRYLNVALILVLLVFDANQILEEKKSVKDRISRRSCAYIHLDNVYCIWCTISTHHAISPPLAMITEPAALDNKNTLYYSRSVQNQ